MPGSSAAVPGPGLSASSMFVLPVLMPGLSVSSLFALPVPVLGSSASSTSALLVPVPGLSTFFASALPVPVPNLFASSASTLPVPVLGLSASSASALPVPLPGLSRRPMLSLDRTRHRPNNPETGPQQQQSSYPVRSSLTEDGPKSESDEDRLPVPKQQQLDFPPSSLQPSLPQVASNTISNAIDSTVPQPPVEATTVPQPLVAAASPLASSHSRGPDSVMIASEPITSLSGLDRRSPNVQAMLREAFSEGRSEGRQENQTKLDEAESKVEELRKRLDPSKLKAAYDRGFREGGLEGYNKYSLHPETKASDERLAFEKIIKEKDQAIQNQQMTMARYEQELMARRHRTQELERQASLPTPRQPTRQQGQNISGQQILEAEARFSTQGQELSIAKSQNELMRADLSNWQVQWGLITADLERWKAAFSAKATQLDACQRQLKHSNRELQESKEEATQLASSKSEEIASLKAAVAAERSAKIESVKALNEELKSNSRQVQDGKDEIDALTSQNTELIKGFGEVEETVSRQDRELQQLSAENEELTRKLQERKEEDERAPLNLNNAPIQDGDEQAEEIDNLPAEFAEETAAADIVGGVTQQA